MMEEEIVAKLKPFFEPEQRFFNNSKDRIIITYWNDLLDLASEYPDRSHLFIDFYHIQTFSPELAEELLNNPTVFLKASTKAVSEVVLPVEIELKNVSVRIINLPRTRELEISAIRAKHLNKFYTIQGVIVNAPTVNPAYEVADFQCLRCGHHTLVQQPVDGEFLQEPFMGCENDTCGKKGPFNICEENSKMYDNQLLKIQELPDNLKGRQPDAIIVRCKNDIAGISYSGEKVIVTGTVKSKFKYNNGKVTNQKELFFDANSIILNEKDYEQFNITKQDIEEIEERAKDPNLLQILLDAVAPSVYGYEDVKLGLLIQLFSGVRKKNPDGTYIRGDIHILLIGNPGTAKSQMLLRCKEISPKAIMTAGRSSTGAGLTGSAVQEDGKNWKIQAGALTLASGRELGGLCIIDEIDKMKPEDRGAIHEALEQQKISIAKAGIVTELPSVCSVLCAANPKYGSFDKYEPIQDQFKLDPPFLTRMDFIFVVIEPTDPEQIRAITEKVLNNFDVKEYDVLSTEKLQKHLVYAKTHCFPVLSEEAKKLITDYYMSVATSKKSRNNIPITQRKTQAIARAATAIAKMRLSDIIDVQDAKIAIQIVDANLKQIGVDPETGEFDVGVLEWGLSGSSREKIETMKNVIASLQEKSFHPKKMVDRELVFEKAKAAGLPEPDKILKKMFDRGLVFGDATHVKLLEKDRNNSE